MSQSRTWAFVRTEARECAVRSWKARATRPSSLMALEAIRGTDDTPLRDDGGDQPGRRDVEGRVIDRRVGGGRWHASERANLRCGPLLDGNAPSRGQGRIDGGKGRG